MLSKDKLLQDASIVSEAQAVLITGGSGFLGQRLVRTLAQEGKSVVSIYRHRLPEPMEGVFPVCSDLANEELLLAPLRGVSTVVHLAWEGSISGAQSASCASKNLSFLKNLLRALEKAKTKRFIFVSAIGASRNNEHPFLREKYHGELLVLNSKIKECIIVRTSLLYGGMGGKFIESIRQLMRIPGTYPLPHCVNKLFPLYVQDLADFLCAIVAHSFTSSRNILEISGDKGYKLEEIFRFVAQGLGKTTIFRLRSFLAQGLLPFFEKFLMSPSEPRMMDYLRLLSQATPLLLAEEKEKFWSDKRQDLASFLQKKEGLSMQKLREKQAAGVV